MSGLKELVKQLMTKLIITESKEHGDLIIKIKDPVLLEYIELSIGQCLDVMPHAGWAAFRQMLDDIRAKKDHNTKK
jgi:hypothetical protein